MEDIEHYRKIINEKTAQYRAEIEPYIQKIIELRKGAKGSLPRNTKGKDRH